MILHHAACLSNLVTLIGLVQTIKKNRFMYKWKVRFHCFSYVLNKWAACIDMSHSETVLYKTCCNLFVIKID